MRTTRSIAALLAAAIAFGAFALPAHAETVDGTIDSLDADALVSTELRPDYLKDPSALLVNEIDAPMTSALPEGDGNGIPFTGFRDGDIIVGFNTWSVGHAGIMDATRGISAYSYCVWSAVLTKPGCVLLEQAIKYRGYDTAFGLWVPYATTLQRSAARRFCSCQIGKPYDLLSSKTDFSRWYCSKLPWAGYKTSSGKDLDANGGYWVTPADLYNDKDTRVFAYGS